MSSDTPASAPDAVSSKVEESCQRVLTLIENIRRNQFNADNGQNKRSDSETSETPARGRRKRPNFSCRSLAIDNYYNVISLIGERGSGKTTLMCKILKELDANERDILLAPIVPERFMGKDYLIGWVLTALQEWIDFLTNRENCDWDMDVDAHPTREERAKLREAFEQVQFEGCKLQALNQNALQINDLFEYSQDRIELFSGNFNLQAKLRKFFDMLTGKNFSAMFKLGNPLIIIPIDDADITPCHVFPIFQQISTFLAHHRVVVLISGDMRTFLHAIRIHLTDTSNGLPVPGARTSETGAEANIQWPYASTLDSPGSDFMSFREDFTDRLLNKYLPHHLRIELSGRNLREKLEFRPEGNDLPLRVILKQIKMSNQPDKTLYDYIYPRQIASAQNTAIPKAEGASSPETFESGTFPLPFSALLPDNLRLLKQMYSLLKMFALHQDKSTPTRKMNAFASVFRLLIHELNAEERLILRQLTDAEICDGTKNFTTDSLNIIDFNGADLAPGIITRNLYALECVQGTTSIGLQVRQFIKSYFCYKKRDLNPVFSSLIFAIQETGRNHRNSKIAFPGKSFFIGDNCNLLHISFNASSSIDLLTLPEWDAFSDCFYCFSAWNRHILHCRLGNTNLNKVEPEKLATQYNHLLLQYLVIVLAVQKHHAIPTESVEGAEPETTEELKNRLNLWAEEVFTYLQDIVAEKRHITIRERDFAQWLLSDLPGCFIPNLGFSRFPELLLTIWKDLARFIMEKNIHHFRPKIPATLCEILIATLGMPLSRRYWTQFKDVCKTLNITVSRELFDDFNKKMTDSQKKSLDSLFTSKAMKKLNSGSAQPPQGTK